MKKVFELFTRMADFNDGVVLSASVLERYRTKTAERLANDDSRNYASIQTGNMLTIAVKRKDKIIVYQCEGYKEHTYRVEKI